MTNQIQWRSDELPRPPRRPVRIGAVLTQLGGGGAERQTFELLRVLRGTPWEPIVVISLSTDLEPYGPLIRGLGYRLEVLPRRSSFDLRRLLHLRSLFRQYQFDLVHAVHLLASGYCWLACHLASGPSLLPTVRGTVVYPGVVRRWIYKRMFANCPYTLVNSYAGTHFLTRNLAAPPERLRVVPNGVDFLGLRKMACPPRLRAELGIGKDEPVVGFVGKNTPVKNVPRFLNVIESLSKQVPRVHAVLLGWGLDASLRSRLAPNLSDKRVHFLGFRPDISAFLRDMDVLVLTSNSEGCPNVVLEALGVGTPVVAADVGDVARIIGTTRIGAAVPPENIESYVRAIMQVLALGPSGREAVRKSWPTLEARYGRQAMVVRTVQLWKEILSNSCGVS